MAAAGVLIFERGQRRWEAALKRTLSPEIWVRPCKTLSDVREQLHNRPGCLVVVTIDGGPETGAILNLVITSPLAAAVMVIARSLSEEAEWLLREIGVDSVLYEPMAESVLAAQCRRLIRITHDDPLENMLNDVLSERSAGQAAADELQAP